MYKVYFGTPMSGFTIRSLKARCSILEKSLGNVPIQILKPWRDLDIASDAVLENQYFDDPIATDNSITIRDRNDIKRSDAVVFWVKGCGEVLSRGLFFEMAWADAFGIPFILVKDDDQQMYDYPMIRATAICIVLSAEPAVRCLKNLLAI